MSQKVNNRGVLICLGGRDYFQKYVGKPLSIKLLKITVLMLLVQLEHSTHCSMYKYIYFRIFCRFLTYSYSGAVYLNIPHSPPVCSLLSELAQYLDFPCFSPMPSLPCHHVNSIMMTPS